MDHPKLTVALALAFGIMAQSVSRLLRLPGIVLLAADVAVDEVRALGWNGLAVVGGLMLLVRPFGIWLATRDLKLTTRERVFIGAIAPRGIVAAAIASITAATLETQSIEGGGAALRALVFSTIAGTVVLSGALAYPLARLLDLRLPQRDRVAIFGVRGLGLLLANTLRDGDAPVPFIESDPKRSHVAEQAGHTVVFGDPLDDRTMQRARMELVVTVIGLTFSEHANSLFVREAREAYGVAHGYVALESFEDQHAPNLVRRSGLDVLFDGPHDQASWDVRSRHDEVDIESFEYRLDVEPEAAAPDSGDAKTSTPEADQGPEDPFVMLTVRRGKHTTPFRLGLDPRTGDIAAVAIHRPARQQAVARLNRLGWRPIGTASTTAT